MQPSTFDPHRCPTVTLPASQTNMLFKRERVHVFDEGSLICMHVILQCEPYGPLNSTAPLEMRSRG